MVERLVRIQEVRGSIPLISTKRKRHALRAFSFGIKEIRGIEGDRTEHSEVRGWEKVVLNCSATPCPAYCGVCITIGSSALSRKTIHRTVF